MGERLRMGKLDPVLGIYHIFSNYSSSDYLRACYGADVMPFRDEAEITSQLHLFRAVLTLHVSSYLLEFNINLTLLFVYLEFWL